MNLRFHIQSIADATVQEVSYIFSGDSYIKRTNRVWKQSDGREIPIFVSAYPAIVKEAQKIICPDAEGVEIRVFFDSETKEWRPDTAHLSERILGEEVMIGQIGGSIVSIFTLAMIKDSSWYDVDLSKAEKFTYHGPVYPNCDLIKTDCNEMADKASRSSRARDWAIYPYCIRKGVSS